MKKLRIMLGAVLVLAVIMLFSLCASAATIASGNCGDRGDNVKWKLDSDGTLTVYGSGAIKDDFDWTLDAMWGMNYDMTKKIKNIVITDGVTRIGDFAFNGLTISSVTMADSVVSIGEGAFVYCGNLKNVKLSENLTEIGKYAFAEFWDSGLGSDLESITIPRSVKKIGTGAFANSGLKSITIPSNVEDIGYGAFNECYNLEKVIIEDGVKKIESCAFYGCDKLKSLHLPASVKEVGDMIVSPTTTLTGDNFVKVDGVVFTKDMKTLVKYPADSTVASYTVPSGVTEIMSYAFADCKSLKKITLNDGLERIRACAFRGMNGEELVVPASVISVGFGDPARAPYGWGGPPNGEWNAFSKSDFSTLYLYSRDVNAFASAGLIYEWECAFKTVYCYSNSKTAQVINGDISKDGEIIYYSCHNGAFTPTFIYFEDMHTHTYGSGVVTKEPTCTQEGIRAFTCDCGESYTEAIAALGHTADKWAEVIPAYVGVCGLESSICKVCGAIIIRETEALPKDRPVFRLVGTETDEGFTVDVMLENNVKGFYNLDFVVRFDKTRLEAYEVDTSSSVASFTAEKGEGRVTVYHDNGAFVSGKGKLCTIKLKAVDGAVGEADITVNAAVDSAVYTAVDCTLKLSEENTEKTVIIMAIGKRVGYVNGIAKAMDAAPIIYNDRAMLPARFVAEALGATVGWDAAERKVTITGKHLKTGEDIELCMFIESKTAYLNGKAFKMDTVPFIRDSRTYTPVRYIAEALGASVEWNNVLSQQTITA